MEWFRWTLAGVIALGGILSVSLIGKPRKPLTPGVVAISVMIDAFLVWGIFALR